MAGLNEFAWLQPFWGEKGVKIMGKWAKIREIDPYRIYRKKTVFLRRNPKTVINSLNRGNFWQKSDLIWVQIAIVQR